MTLYRFFTMPGPHRSNHCEALVTPSSGSMWTGGCSWSRDFPEEESSHEIDDLTALAANFTPR